MNLMLFSINFKRKNKGMALVLVMMSLVIVIGLMISMMVMTRRDVGINDKERVNVETQILADNAINLVVAQISEGTRQEMTPGREHWVSQPGMIRKYKQNGQLLKAYKLYSDEQMIWEDNENQLVAETPERNWQKIPEIYTDLNEPRYSLDVKNSTIERSRWVFPILDPRAYVEKERMKEDQDRGYNRRGSLNVEGFWYDCGMKLFPGTKPAVDHQDSNARLPMPVKWLYLNQDGSMGVIQEDKKNANGAYLIQPLHQQEIGGEWIGRMAFWVDDESCKVNINTASEPTFWQTPMLMHSRDQDWAKSQPARYEYQRYPGHPATTALSAVVMPNIDLDTYGKSIEEQKRICTLKEMIGLWSPKIVVNSSDSGTKCYWQKSSKKGTSNIFLKTAEAPLFASLDECLFQSSKNEEENQKNRPIWNWLEMDGIHYIKHGRWIQQESGNDRINRWRGFLTTSSRSPELNPLGGPKISIWPISMNDQGGDSKKVQTIYDQCVMSLMQVGDQKMGGYWMERRSARSGQIDGEHPHNKALFDYLNFLLNQPLVYGQSFVNKWGKQNTGQMVAQLCDFIRTVNLYDGSLATPLEKMRLNSIYQINTIEDSVYKADECFIKKESLRKIQKTFTDAKAFNKDLYYIGRQKKEGDEPLCSYAFPGSGQVTPLRIELDGGTYKGLGRFPVLSEVGFHFICTADGTPDPGSYAIPIIQNGVSIDQWRRPNGNSIEPMRWRELGYSQDKQYQVDSIDCVYSGGRTAVVLNNQGEIVDGKKALTSRSYEKYSHGYGEKFPAFWFSNFPPLSDLPNRHWYGTIARPPSLKKDAWKNHPRNRENHPGYDPVNWNYTLDRDQPLKVGQKRIQMALVLELTNIAPGFPGWIPDFSIKVKGLKNLKISEYSTFQSSQFKNEMRPYNSVRAQEKEGGDDEWIWRSNGSENYGNDCSIYGGSLHPLAMSQRRACGGRGEMKADVMATANDQDHWKNKGYQSAGELSARVRNMNFHSNYFTIEAPVLGIESRLVIEVYSGTDVSREENRVQVYEVDFKPSLSERMPAPELVVLSRNPNGGPDPTPLLAPQWWTFHFDGVMGRNEKTGLPSGRYASILRGRAGFNEGIRDEGTLVSGALPGNLDWFFGKVLEDFDFVKGNTSRKIAKLTWANNPKEWIEKKYTRLKSNEWSTSGKGNELPISGKTFQHRFDSVSPFARPPYGQDVVVTKVPVHGDLRLLAAQPFVGAEHWMRHPAWDGKKADPSYLCHSFFGKTHQRMLGSIQGDGSKKNSEQWESMIPLVKVPKRQMGADFYKHLKKPDLCFGDIKQLEEQPCSNQINFTSVRNYGDFDHGQGEFRAGPWIRLPDGGSLGLTEESEPSSGKTKTLTTYKVMSSYLDLVDQSEPLSAEWMSPNRLIASPVAFGSLPTFTHESNQQSFCTLLFRPYTAPLFGKQKHPGQADSSHSQVVGDHQLLDLFQMPVVEPYPMSANLATAGKINLNYQLFPFFSYISRTTALHALMKDIWMGAINHADISDSKSQGIANSNKMARAGVDQNDAVMEYSKKSDDSRYLSRHGLSEDEHLRFWHRKIDIERRINHEVQGTLAQFENRFLGTRKSSIKGLFRLPSELCEIHLIPKKVKGQRPTPLAFAVDQPAVGGGDGSDPQPEIPYQVDDMGAFWRARAATGEDIKELPYQYLYPRVCTQSNVFRVHYRVQRIQKARSGSCNGFDPRRDRIVSEQRGSALIERWVQSKNSMIPDYKREPQRLLNEPVDQFYQTRILEHRLER